MNYSIISVQKIQKFFAVLAILAMVFGPLANVQFVQAAQWDNWEDFDPEEQVLTEYCSALDDAITALEAKISTSGPVKQYILGLVLVHLNNIDEEYCSEPAAPDTDEDGTPDETDNCPASVNEDQADSDEDSEGDACDETPNGEPEIVDICHLPQGNAENVQILEDMPFSSWMNNGGQGHSEHDGDFLIVDEADMDACLALVDQDDDGVNDEVDNCPLDANPGQEDADEDGEGDVCDDTPNGPEPVCEDENAINEGEALPCTYNSVQVHIFKYLKDGNTFTQIPDDAGIAPFPMVSSWNHTNGSFIGNGSYTLGEYKGGATLKYAADTAEMGAPADYATSEVTGTTVLAAGEQCVYNKYRLVGYKEGTTLLEAEADEISTTSPAFTDLTSDRYVIVVNEDCDDVIADAEISETIVITGNTSAGENQPGWLFNRDTNTDTPFEFNTDEKSIGDGSLYVLPIGANASDKFIAENFINAPIADIDAVSYDFMIGAVDADDAEQFYMNVYANFGVSADNKFYDCRYDVVPTVGSTAGFTTVTFDPAQDYPVTTRGGAEASPYTCPASPADMDTLSGGSTIRVFALNVGDSSTSDAGVSGYLDKVVVDTIAKKTTYDFEPLPPLCSVTVVSDDTNTVIEKEGAFAELLSFVHNGWTAAIDGAEWIWGDNPVVDPTTEETQTFVKTFEWNGPVSEAELQIASDNMYEVTLNGTVIASSTDENNFQTGTQDTAVVTGVQTGVNTLEIAVTNKGVTGSNAKSNPAGLLYNLTVVGTEEGDNCQTAPVEASLEITNPAVDGTQLVAAPYTFEAEYNDDDDVIDNILWAIRANTCAANTGTVAGNVDGHSDVASFVGNLFSALVDMTGWADGDYCLVVNPQEQGGEDLRATRLFTLETPVAAAPYCGDGQVNQTWEECDGSEMCADYCMFDNQCHTTQLAKITLDQTASVSFDGMIYLGTSTNAIPSGAWFNLEDLGDSMVNHIADVVDGLAVERDHGDDTLKLAFRGGNDRRDIDIVAGEIELLGARTIPGNILRAVIGTDYKLENDAPAFIDIFENTGNTHIDFDMRTDVGNDGVTMPILADEEYGQCIPDDENPGGGDDEEKTYRISGNIWNDENENDERDYVEDENEGNDELYLGGWTVTAKNGSTTIATTTDENGFYVLEVPAGTWQIEQGSPEGWTFSYPDDGFWEVTVGDTSLVEEDNFFASLMSFVIPTAHAMVAPSPSNLNFGVFQTNNDGGDGGNGSRISLRSGGSNNDNDDRPEGIVLGEATSTLPVGAPNTGNGGASPVSFGLHAVVAILGTRNGVRATHGK